MIERYIDQIKTLQNLGYTTMEIAKKLHINPTSLYCYFHTHRELFPRQRSYRMVSEEESADFYKECIDEGLTQTEIAKKHNVAPETVHRHILKQIKKHSK